MSRFTRAAGLAAAMFAALLGTPSLAWEFDTPTLLTPDLGIAAPHQGVQGIPAEASIQPSPAPASEAAVPLEAAEKSEPPVPRNLSELVSLHSSSATADAEHECLANAVYFESKGEPLAGQLSVAEVVLNRARSGRFASSVCGVVKQRGQFSFVRGGVLPSVDAASRMYRTAVAVAKVAMRDAWESPAPKALFFNGRRVGLPGRLTKVGVIGNHIFYR